MHTQDLCIAKHALARVRERMPHHGKGRDRFRQTLERRLKAAAPSFDKPVWYDDRLSMHIEGVTRYLALNDEGTEVAVIIPNFSGPGDIVITVLFEGFVWE